jgi:hypothetical protein
LVVLRTVALNCCVCPAPKFAAVGVTDTEIPGVSVIVAVAVLVGSLMLAAVTVTVCEEVTVAGAV